MLREAVRSGSALGQQVRELISMGSLVSDEQITDLVRERLGAADVSRGWVLDGFPRTVVQAQALDELVPGDGLVVALIQVSEDEIASRLGRRRVCTSCRLTQSVSEASNSRAEDCPYCGGTLARRDDDDVSIVRHRLAAYAQYAAPVIAYYRPRPGFVTIDGAQDPEAVTSALFDGITRRIPDP
jgi:adenylate kinase